MLIELFVLARLSGCMCFKQRRILIRAFIEVQLGYLLLMFYERVLEKKTNHLHDP